MREIETQNLANNPEKVGELPRAEWSQEDFEKASIVLANNFSQKTEKDIPKGDRIDIKRNEKVSYSLSPIGTTKASHEENKKRRKAGAKSRKINRHK